MPDNDEQQKPSSGDQSGESVELPNPNDGEMVTKGG